MKISVRFFIPLLFLANICIGQLKPGAVNASLAYSDLSGYGNKFTIFTNPAGLTYQNNNYIAIFHSPAPFEIKQLATSAAVFKHNFSYGNLSAGYMRYGFELYRQNSIFLGYGREVYSSLFLGLTTEYRNISIERYGNTSAINMLFGLTWFPFDNLAVSTVLENPLRFKYFSTDETLESLFSFGSSYLISDLLKLSATVASETDRATMFSYGMEIYLHKNVTIRCGNNNVYEMVTVGAGINYLFAELDYALLIHDYLGYTHQVEINAEF